jgi:hypothetical protein
VLLVLAELRDEGAIDQVFSINTARYGYTSLFVPCGKYRLYKRLLLHSVLSAIVV